MQSGEEIWSALRDSLRSSASEAVWSAGLNKLCLVDYANGELIIGAPNQIQLQRVQQRYLPFITEQARELAGSEIQILLTLSDVDVLEREEAPVTETTSSAPVISFSPSIDKPARLDPRMTFDSFVPGSSNNLAFAAAQSVA